MRHIIGVDIGTTNIKAVALDDEGRLLAQAARSAQYVPGLPGRLEQEPEVLFQQVVRVVRAVCQACPPGSTVAGLVFSGAMHSLLAVDRNGTPLTNAWLWSDLRAAELAEALRDSADGREIYRRTGVPVHPMSPLLKLMWMRRHRAAVFEQAYYFLGIKDFILQKILGEYVSDASVASASGLLNTRSGQWDTTALQAAAIDAGRLPVVVSPLRVFALPARAAALLGLPAGLPIIPGASDGALANLGSGAEGPDRLAVTVGTSAALRLTIEAPYFDPAMRTFCYRIDDHRFIAGGASNNGSNTVEWLRKQVLQTNLSTARLLEQAAATDPGAEGLLFVPYLLGERAPVWNAYATGMFQGLKARHGRAHLMRAVVEGVAFNLKLIAASLPLAATAERIVLSGGVAQSALWRQVVADIFQKPVLLPAADGVDASARGAVMMARSALGLPPMPVQKPLESAMPIPQNVEKYATSFQRFSQLCALRI